MSKMFPVCRRFGIALSGTVFQFHQIRGGIMLKIKHFEFWNTHLFHFPIYLYWAYLSLKARSLFFFSAANPGIESGGLIGESKYKILEKINPVYIPKTIYYGTAPSVAQTLTDIKDQGIGFPFVVKPDIGQGGWLIDMIKNDRDLSKFLSSIKMPFMIQEFIDCPIEVGLLYYRFPEQKGGTISSLSLKHLLTVTGDGKHTISQLVKLKDRGTNQLKRLQKDGRLDTSRVPAACEVVPLSFVGNHSYGTMFTNENYLIDQRLTSIFDELSSGIEGFYFGRFDIRCQTIADLWEGRFKILELNGVGSEPLHIFDPREKLIDAYRSAFHHWDIIYQISIMNRKRKTPFMQFKDALKTYRMVTQIQRLHNTAFTIGNY
jgi:hypothetical protein